MRIYPKSVTLECFNLIGDPVPVSPGFPTVREPHRPEGNRGIEAFGNDGSKRSGNNSLRSKPRGIKPEVIEQLERLEL